MPIFRRDPARAEVGPDGEGSSPRRASPQGQFPGLRSQLAVIRSTVRRYPSVVIVPLLVLVLVVGLGVFGVLAGMAAMEERRQTDAKELASTTLTAFSLTIQQAYTTVAAIAVYIKNNPDWVTFSAKFDTMTQSLLEASYQNPALVQVEAAPNGVLSSAYPNWVGGVGLDILACCGDDAMREVTYGSLKVDGPYAIQQGQQALITSLPVFLPSNVTSGPDPVWRQPPSNGSCFAPACYNTTTKMKWWGTVYSIIFLYELLEDPGTKLTGLKDGGWWFTLRRVPIAFSNTSLNLVLISHGGTLRDPVRAAITVGGTTYELLLEPASGWQYAWWPAVITAVVVLGIILAVLVFFTMMAKRQKAWLLYSILPRPVVQTLRRGGQWSHKSDCCVLFADVVGFTKITSTMLPEDIAAMVGQLFNVYEDITAQHQLTKVDIIGDCFMAAAGMMADETPEDCAVKAVRLALDMVSCTEGLVTRDGQPIQIRIGLHAGPVVAVVVGVQSPKLTVFGDVVNTCSRVQSTSLPGCVQVSSIVAERLVAAGAEAKGLMLVERGMVELRNRGSMETFWVRRASSVPSSTGDVTGLGGYLPYGPDNAATALDISLVEAEEGLRNRSMGDYNVQLASGHTNNVQEETGEEEEGMDGGGAGGRGARFLGGVPGMMIAMGPLVNGSGHHGMMLDSGSYPAISDSDLALASAASGQNGGGASGYSGHLPALLNLRGPVAGRSQRASTHSGGRGASGHMSTHWSVQTGSERGSAGGGGGGGGSGPNSPAQSRSFSQRPSPNVSLRGFPTEPVSRNGSQTAGRGHVQLAGMHSTGEVVPSPFSELAVIPLVVDPDRSRSLPDIPETPFSTNRTHELSLNPAQGEEIGGAEAAYQEAMQMSRGSSLTATGHSYGVVTTDPSSAGQQTDGGPSSWLSTGAQTRAAQLAHVFSLNNPSNNNPVARGSGLRVSSGAAADMRAGTTGGGSGSGGSGRLITLQEQQIGPASGGGKASPMSGQGQGSPRWGAVAGPSHLFHNQTPHLTDTSSPSWSPARNRLPSGTWRHHPSQGMLPSQLANVRRSMGDIPTISAPVDAPGSALNAAAPAAYRAHHRVSLPGVSQQSAAEPRLVLDSPSRGQHRLILGSPTQSQQQRASTSAVGPRSAEPTSPRCDSLRTSAQAGRPPSMNRVRSNISSSSLVLGSSGAQVERGSSGAGMERGVTMVSLASAHGPSTMVSTSGYDLDARDSSGTGVSRPSDSRRPRSQHQIPSSTGSAGGKQPKAPRRVHKSNSHNRAEAFWGHTGFAEGGPLQYQYTNNSTDTWVEHSTGLGTPKASEG